MGSRGTGLLRVISPRGIQERARKLWASGRPLRAIVANVKDTPFFPYSVPFRRHTAREWLESFAELRSAVDALEAQSKAVTGAGYALVLRETSHQKLGRLRIPDTITFESIEDLAACADQSDSLHRFRSIARLIGEREPQLLAWVAERPLVALQSEPVLTRLLDTVAYLQAHPRPKRYARELGLPGVDSKFIEANRRVLCNWLDRLLPTEGVDAAVSGRAGHGFERRYGLCFDEPLIRFRWLDRSRAFGVISDVSVPLSQLAAYRPCCDCVLITDNKINFLTIPPRADALALFGSGYAIDLLRAIPWLADRSIFYWGDLDTHGFAMLSRMREVLPNTRSFLMNRETLLTHRELWTEELSATRVLRDLEGLDPDERALYDDLRRDRLGDRVRLEQERVRYPWVERAVSALRS
jgi:hypothetical protein